MPRPVEIADDVAPTRRRWSLGRLAVFVTVVGIAALWGYVLYLALGPGRKDPPDTLRDPTFAEQAEDRCQAALDDVASLPAAAVTQSTTERAEVLDQATDRFELMVDDLEALAPGGEDGEIVELWLADWRTYLQDRREHAEALRAGDDRRFQVSARDATHITEYIDEFARINDLAACGSPLDV